MSEQDGWYLTMPEDSAGLLDEFARHGVTPGMRVTVTPVNDEDTEPPQSND